MNNEGPGVLERPKVAKMKAKKTGGVTTIEYEFHFHTTKKKEELDDLDKIIKLRLTDMPDIYFFKKEHLVSYPDERYGFKLNVSLCSGNTFNENDEKDYKLAIQYENEGFGVADVVKLVNTLDTTNPPAS